ncbi:MAG: HesA/MoeB/ThiF family protein, partial [Rhodospirillaceae bacterium]|nr:HesA/MoeB/ThiF family protein [Rhodospirillaceae bacterium]
MGLSPDQNARYARQILLPEVGGAGQEALRVARVLVIGAGGLGSPVLLYLAAAGVGHLTIADDDTVALSNLQRQVLYDTDAVGKSKAVCAAQRLSALNPEVQISAWPNRVTADTVAALVSAHDVTVECCDTFGSRLVVGD